jgi:alanine racemase
MHTNSVIELNKKAYQNNLAFLKATFGPSVQLSAVVKGNAYGHGLKEFVAMAQEEGITHFSVFDMEEARIVYETIQDKAEIVVMGLVQDSDLEWAIQHQVGFFVFDLSRLQATVLAAKKLNQKAIVHIEVETGMNRTGFERNQLDQVIAILTAESDFLIFDGLCTHYAGAESIANLHRVQEQIARYHAIYQYLCEAGIKPRIKHSACSAASMMFPETRMDLVRVGIMQYGLWPSPEVYVNYLNNSKTRFDPLQRVISWKSAIMSIKEVETGDFIGYGTSFLAERPMRIAVIPLGYSHGYSRSLSNQGRVLINGHRCIVVGSVNMNMITVDVTDVVSVKKDDEVVLIGDQNEVTVSVASFSDFSNQLNYELLTRIAKTIPRKIVS